MSWFNGNWNFVWAGLRINGRILPVRSPYRGKRPRPPVCWLGLEVRGLLVFFFGRREVAWRVKEAYARLCSGFPLLDRCVPPPDAIASRRTVTADNSPSRPCSATVMSSSV